MTTETTTEAIALQQQTVVATKMSKKEAASLVRFLTEAISTSDSDIDVRIDIYKDYADGAEARISVDNNTLFGSTSRVIAAREIKYERVTKFAYENGDLS